MFVVYKLFDEIKLDRVTKEREKLFGRRENDSSKFADGIFKKSNWN